MGFFTRVADIITANVHALLDRAENPELMTSQVIREMEDGLARARRLAATAIAAERRLGRELDQNRARAAYWRTRAKEALAAGREELARRTLARKKLHDDLVHDLEGQYAEALETGGTVRTALGALEARLVETRRRQRTLVARHRAAQARVEVHHLLGAGMTDFGSARAKFARLENRLVKSADESIALADLLHPADSLDAELADLDREQAVTQELEALRREIKSSEQ